MKNLNYAEQLQVSAAASFRVVQEITTSEISENCLNAFCTLSDELIIESCSSKEFTAYASLVRKTKPVTIELI